MANAVIFSYNPQTLADSVGFIEVLRKQGFNVDKVIGVTSEFQDISELKKLGLSKIFIYNSNSSDDQIAVALKNIYQEFSPALFISSSSKLNNSILSYLAGLLKLPMLTEVIDVKEVSSNSLSLIRSVLAGRANSFETVKIPSIITVAPKKFMPSGTQASQSVEISKLSLQESKVRVINVEPKKREGVKIEDAEIIVGVGRGFKAREDLKLAFDLAYLLKGEVGCSRPIAADLKWLPEDRWIGISMKKIRPKLYVAVGISGAPQHMSAVDAKVIVAINKDKNAPIFNYADYGVIADLYQFLPVLINKLKK
ncbi:MAG: electron transfer flavoprotein subunit alpha/FixB family protein [Sulfolobus sp.]|nr:electron transfer flavoprotein subunit alpha/FixB family protein [Sulfolobus sp.]